MSYGRGRFVFHFALLLFVLATILVTFLLVLQADGMASGGNHMPTKNKWMGWDMDGVKWYLLAELNCLSEFDESVTLLYYSMFLNT